MYEHENGKDEIWTVTTFHIDSELQIENGEGRFATCVFSLGLDHLWITTSEMLIVA